MCQTFLIAIRCRSERKERKRGKEENLRQKFDFQNFATFERVPSHSTSSLSLTPPSSIMPYFERRESRGTISLEDREEPPSRSAERDGSISLSTDTSLFSRLIL